MSTVAPVKSNKSYPPAPAGTHVARVYKFMNLGKRLQQYKGVDKAHPDTLVTFTIELPNELNEFEYEDKDTGETKKVSKPFVVSQEFTLSMHKKSRLRPFVEGILGTTLTDEEAGAFDIEELVGMPCQVTIIHNKSADGEKTYANIKSVAPLMKGIEAPEAINEPVKLDVKTMTKEEIEALPDFLRNKIVISDEYKGRFDENEIARKARIQETIDERKGFAYGTEGGADSKEDDIEIPF